MKKRYSFLSILLLAGVFIAGFVLLNQDPYGSKTITSGDNSQVQTQHIPSFSPPVYTDDFDGANDTTALKARGYKVWYRGSGPQGLTATWFQGNATVFPSFNGPSTGYVAANYNVVTGLNNIDSWLVLPYMSGGLVSGDSLYFYSRGPTGSTYPDSIRVMVSVSDSVPEGTWVELGRFKVNIAGAWERRGFVSSVAGTHARFAIRYNVVNGGPSGTNSDFIGIDALQVVRSSTPPSVNRCLLFPTPGVNTNYVMIPHQAGMVGFTSITIEGWVKIGNSTAPNTILNKGGSSFDYQLGINATTTNPFFRGIGTVVIANTITVTPGVWTHLAVTLGGGTIKFYKDGVMSFTTTTAAVMGSSTNEMRIGRGGSDPASGNIDEIRLWDVVRTDAEISSQMCNKWVPNNAPGLKGKWHFDSTLVDSVNSWNGTILGNVGYDTVSWCPITGIQQTGTEVPGSYVLGQNYPNPFNPSTVIKFSIPKGGYVEIKLFDIAGREVAALVSDPFAAGTYAVDFDGSKLASGVYFYKITAGDFTATKKMVLVK